MCIPRCTRHLTYHGNFPRSYIIGGSLVKGNFQLINRLDLEFIRESIRQIFSKNSLTLRIDILLPLLIDSYLDIKAIFFVQQLESIVIIRQSIGRGALTSKKQDKG